MGLTRKQTLKPTEVLEAMLAIDGQGSRLDADLLDGKHAADIISAAVRQVTDLTSYTGQHNKIPMGSTEGKLDKSWLPDGIGGGDSGAAAEVQQNLDSHKGDTVSHITAAERTSWNGKANAADLTNHINNKNNPHGVTAAQIGAVPTSRTINGKTLSADIILSAADVGAMAENSGVGYVVGSYTGDEAVNKTVTLGFKPKFVYVFQNDSYYYMHATESGYGGLDSYSSGNSRFDSFHNVTISNTGFTINYEKETGINRFNYSGTVYCYIAFQ